MRFATTSLALLIAVLTSGCVIHVDESSELGRGNFLSPFVGVETHPYVPGQDWAGWGKERYKITHTDCPRENRGGWLDGAYSWVEISGDEVILGLEGMPQLEGNFAANTAKLDGEMVFMANDANTRCVVNGNVTLHGNDMGGELEETLTGGIDCATRAKYTIELPNAH